MVPGKVLVSLLLFLSSVVAVPVVSVVQSVVKTEAPLISAINAEVILDKYIVVFKDEVRSHQIEHHHDCIRDFIDTENANFAKHGSMEELVFGIEHTYNFTNFQGYSGRFTNDMLKKIRQSNEVAYVEKDQLVYANNLQTNAPWGLSRISHRDPLSFSNFGKYPYDQKSGEGVTIYIIDTGVNTNHTDFSGRARWGKTIPSGDINVDGNGHGTHVAGTTAGTRYGVAKNANVVAVKVLRSNGSGTMSDVVKGIEWVADAHLETVKQAKAKNKAFKGSTANMSLGGGRSRALDAAVNGAVDVGIHFAVAAGNDNRDACDYSPAAAEKAITVGASTIEDERAWFSNYGQCVDIFAPGKDITSAWIGSSNATNTISGTSMAAPHIAGLAAYFLSLQPDDQSEFYTRPLSPALFKTFLINLSTRNILDKIPSNTPNKLAFNDYLH